MTGIPLELPDLCESGHVLVVTGYYPPTPGGSSVIMHNLLSCFNPASYSIVTASSSATHSIQGSREAQVYHLMSSIGFSSRLDRRWRDWQLPRAVSRLIRLIEHVAPRVIVGVYPDFHFLALAREAARMMEIPWIAYLHDTLAEGLSNSHLAPRAIQLQTQVFAEASSILVMSRGMAALYERKYSLACKPLEHAYPEPISQSLQQDSTLRQAFCGGEIYGINAHAVCRVSEALRRISCPLFLATSTTPRNLKRYGIGGDHITIGFYSKRTNYLDVLRRQGILVLALDWPDESSFHEDELSTIFPTKTPEYLASGRPILVHCPEHYFLARFFQTNRCGLVVTERSIEALADASRYILENPTATRAMTRSALSVVRMFAADRIAVRFQREVQTVAHLKWGQRTPRDVQCGIDHALLTSQE